MVMFVTGVGVHRNIVRKYYRVIPRISQLYGSKILGVGSERADWGNEGLSTRVSGEDCLLLRIQDVA